MHHAHRCMLAVLVLSAATVSPVFAGPNEHAADQGKEHASDKSKGDEQKTPPQPEVKGKHANEAQPAATGKGAPHQNKGKATGRDKEHAE